MQASSYRYSPYSSYAYRYDTRISGNNVRNNEQGSVYHSQQLQTELWSYFIIWHEFDQLIQTIWIASSCWMVKSYQTDCYIQSMLNSN